MREKLIRFMQGRYGNDQFSRFLLGVAVVILLVNMFLRLPFVNLFVMGLIVYIYFRMFSKNISKRYAENQAYMRLRGKVVGFFYRQKGYRNQKKTHRIFACPKCKQKIRVPKGKGKICITCPKCRTEFIKKS